MSLEDSRKFQLEFEQHLIELTDPTRRETPEQKTQAMLQREFCMTYSRVMTTFFDDQYPIKNDHALILALIIGELAELIGLAVSSVMESGRGREGLPKIIKMAWMERTIERISNSADGFFNSTEDKFNPQDLKKLNELRDLLFKKKEQ